MQSLCDLFAEIGLSLVSAVPLLCELGESGGALFSDRIQEASLLFLMLFGGFPRAGLVSLEKFEKVNRAFAAAARGHGYAGLVEGCRHLLPCLLRRRLRVGLRRQHFSEKEHVVLRGETENHLRGS